MATSQDEIQQWTVDINELPTEMLELVFLQLTDEQLFAMAAVCRTYNHLSSIVRFRTSGPEWQTSGQGTLNVSDFDLLRCAYRSFFYTPPIVELTCAFREQKEFLHGLRILAKIVAAPTLRHMEVEFSKVPLPLGLRFQPENDLETRARRLAFCELISAMATKCEPGPVICVDISRTTKRPPSELRLREGAEDVEDTWTAVTLNLISVFRMRSLKSDTVDSLNTYTLIESNPHHRRGLTLAGQYHHSAPSPEEFAVILPHLTFPGPKLTKLTIGEIRVDVASLSQFLLRHPAVRTIFYSMPDLWTPDFLIQAARSTLRKQHANDAANFALIGSGWNGDERNREQVTIVMPPCDSGRRLGNSLNSALNSIAGYRPRSSKPATLRLNEVVFDLSNSGADTLAVMIGGSQDARISRVGKVSLYGVRISTARRILSLFEQITLAELFIDPHPAELGVSTEWDMFMEEVKHKLSGTIVRESRDSIAA
ncbi:hypothetical protein C8R46DRAFT_1326215 [Mycena filopes]|nr:hypothetical protein C8R46DRAFT_1326215 [Mycena filopes]